MSDNKALTIAKSRNLTARKANSVAARSRGNLAARKKAGDLMALGFAAIHQLLNDEVVQHFSIAAQCTAECCGDVEWLHRIPKGAAADRVEAAKAYHRSALARADKAQSAAWFLGHVIDPDEDDAITTPQAAAMLHVLFVGMTGKSHEHDEAMAKVAECADIFSPSSNALGKALGLWQPVPTHPVILALTIRELRASKVFEPGEAELREALSKVAAKLKDLRRWTDNWLHYLQEADIRMFEIDRDGWRAAHIAADGEALGIVTEDDPGEHAWALDEIFDELFDDYGNRREPPKQIAACAKPAAKRTQKPRSELTT